MWRNFFEGIGSFFEWTFGLIKFLGDLKINIVFMILIAGAFLYWLGQMVKHQKAGEK